MAKFFEDMKELYKYEKLEFFYWVWLFSSLAAFCIFILINIV